MILIGLGGNLASHAGAPVDTFRSALRALDAASAKVVRVSSLYVSPPWPSGDGPEFFNQAAEIETRLPPGSLLQLLLRVEAAHGRVRRDKWGPRTLDLDILDYHGLITDIDFIALPHPWVEQRAFVLKPVAEIAPKWRHPISGLLASEALGALDSKEASACRAFSTSKV